MSKAVIKKNIPYCPTCDQALFVITDVGVVKHEGEPFFEFTKRCDKCGREHIYYIDLDFKNRYSFKNVEYRFNLNSAE